MTISHQLTCLRVHHLGRGHHRVVQYANDNGPATAVGCLQAKSPSPSAVACRPTGSGLVVHGSHLHRIARHSTGVHWHHIAAVVDRHRLLRPAAEAIRRPSTHHFQLLIYTRLI